MTTRRTNEEQSQTRNVVKLDFEMNFAVGATPTFIAQNECVNIINEAGAGAYTIQLLGTAKRLMRPGYARELPHSYHFTNSAPNTIRWGNYDQANGTLPFTIHPDGAVGSAAADPGNAANLNLRVRLRFKNSREVKF
jgi:hypothetical protein